MAKKPTRTVAYVRWFDSCYQHGECTTDEVMPGIDQESVGFLVKEDAKSISLALDLTPSEGTWRQIMSIPKVNVTSVKRFKV